jgi:cell division protein FtsW (lipid II flippase)
MSHMKKVSFCIGVYLLVFLLLLLLPVAGHHDTLKYHRGWMQIGAGS